MNLESHYRNLRESLRVIEYCIEQDLTEYQRTIGFNTSAASADLLEIFLHTLHLIDPGSSFKHEWFKSKNKIAEKFPFEFPRKAEILSLMYNIEERRNLLCYGKPQPAQSVQEVLQWFNQLKTILREAGVHGI